MLDDEEQGELFSGLSDLKAAQWVLEHNHHDLPGIVTRLRWLGEVGDTMGSGGAMLFGGSTVAAAWGEARLSYVYGNFVSTILLCQSLLENLLAAYLSLRTEDLPERVRFEQTVKRAEADGLLHALDSFDLKRLSNLRNPLSHFRTMDDPYNIDRRAMTEGRSGHEILQSDATFALMLSIRILSRSPFRVG